MADLKFGGKASADFTDSSYYDSLLITMSARVDAIMFSSCPLLPGPLTDWQLRSGILRGRSVRFFWYVSAVELSLL